MPDESFRQNWISGANALRAAFESAKNDRQAGLTRLHAQAALMDSLLRDLHTRTCAARNIAPDSFALVATGGYGRGELAPFSDIDLLFLLPEKSTPAMTAAVEAMLYVLWDAGLKVGHAVRTPKETLAQAKADVSIATSLLEARFLAGNAALADSTLSACRAALSKPGNGAGHLEPDIKNGTGGLRDIQTIAWLDGAKFLSPDDSKKLARAQAFLSTLRCTLHDITGHAQDRLTFDLQPEMARRLGYTDRPGAQKVERFMRHLLLVMQDVALMTGQFLDSLKPVSASRQGLVLKNEQKNPVLLSILSGPENPETALADMAARGVLRHLVPAFGHITARMQFDMYHTRTVDAHTIAAMGFLHRIRQGEAGEDADFITQALRPSPSWQALCVATFLHDIGKGHGGDHAIKGAHLTRGIAPRLGLSPEETETAAWLVENHLLMSHAALRRDIEDDKTVQDFVAIVQSPDRLRLLLALTAADIMAVGPGRWTGWKAALLHQLYGRALAEMTGEELANRPAHTEPVRMRAADMFTLQINDNPSTQTSEITICTGDRPGLFSLLAGSISLTGGNILDAHISTLENGLAVDVFTVQTTNGQPFDTPRHQRLEKTLHDALDGTLDLEAELAKRRASLLPSRRDSIPVAARVIFDNQASHTATVIEINGRDRPGLLHDITRTLSALGLGISSARIATYGTKVVDVFYVKDANGQKITVSGHLDAIREELLKALEN